MEGKIVALVFFSVFVVGYGFTDTGDAAVIKAFRDGIENPEALTWPASGDDPCGPPSWKNVFCQNGRVHQIQTKNLKLKGTLPKNLNQLSMLDNLGLQNNQLTGQMPSLSGLKNLEYAYLDNNNFDSIPGDCFKGLDSLQVLALDGNNFNGTAGWMFTEDILGSAQLQTLSCMKCNLAGDLPGFLGNLSSLTVLKLAGNRITGPIPASFQEKSLQTLWLNDQSGGGMTGPIYVVATMPSLVNVWLHGNQFTGTIPENIGDLTSLKEFNVNGNKLIGLVPDGLAGLQLDNLDLNNNQLMGPIPKFKAAKSVYEMNDWCNPTPGVPCPPEVMALLEFLGELNYPPRLVSSWTGNDSCQSWLGVSCSNAKVSVINLPKFGLNGTLSPSIGRLDGLTQIRLADNGLSGVIPENWTGLKSLQNLDLRNNHITAPVPKFSGSVLLMLDGNPSQDLPPGPSGGNPSIPPAPSGGHPSIPPAPSGGNPSKDLPPAPSPGGGSLPSSPDSSSVGTNSTQSSPYSHSETPKSNTDNSSKGSFMIKKIVIPSVGAVLVASLLLAGFLIFSRKKKKTKPQSPTSLVIHPRDPSDPNNLVKIVVADNTNVVSSTLTGSSSDGRTSGESHLFEAGNLVISVQLLRNATNNFAPVNELGRGGFGVVYEGELDNGTKIAVKRMESGVISNKALDEFHSEISVLSKVRHRHLVSLLGYSVEGNEKLLVYEYMPQGALSRYLFNWKKLNLEPLSWKRRLIIALDVARGVEYLHTLAHQSFIHRDLKSSNILLGDDFRAKVSDFGLVKLAPDGERSMVTRLAGTFGYLAPEYAVTGKVTTKVDVFSFGVVLMELLTGLMALDESRPEEKQYLAAWFWHIKSDKEKLRANIDPVLEAKEETLDSITAIAELAGHCTAREPNQRPDIGHCVNILAPLVEKWKPTGDDSEEYGGIDYSLPLNEMVKDWQDSEGKGLSYMDLEDSKSSIPSRPTGFADSFTSADGR